MIKCPRCGADAQWGAPHCPNCFALFVAPPKAAPQQQVFLPLPSVPAPNRLVRSLAVVSALGLAALLVILWSTFGRGRGVDGAKVAGRSGVCVAGAGPLVGTSQAQEGIFQVKKQVQEAPVIAIIDDTSSDLRLVMQDSSGAERTELIQSGGSKDLTVPQRAFIASHRCAG